ncbi:MAG: hypothetical protein IJZ35_03480 [Clostridia bacterium]|nr:hypothetical protein [Clostridia bacterium]
MSKTKKLLSIILAILMIASTVSVAFAAETQVLYIGELGLNNQYTTDGTTAVDGAPGDDVSSYAYWDYETKTLTLKNYTQTITAKEYAGNTYHGIYYANDINLVLIGANEISVVSTDSSYEKDKNTSGIESSNSITVTGTGSLTISSPVLALSAMGDITLNCDGPISVTTTSYESGIRAGNTVDIKKGTINISSDEWAISASQLSVANAAVTASSDYDTVISVYYDVAIKDSTVKAICNKPNFTTAYNGIDSSNGSITIEGSEIEASGSIGNNRVAGMAIKAADNIIINDSTVTASAGTGLRFNGSSCAIANSTVNLTSTGTANSARGIYGKGVSVTNSTVTITSAKAAYNNVPTVNADESVIFYGADAAAANGAGVKSAENLSSAYSQKYVKITPIPESCLAGEHNTETVGAKAKTCTTVGWDAYEYCKDCTYSTYEEISASHNIETVEAKAKTCTEAGWDAYEYCKDCTYSTYEEILASHDIETVEAKVQTCTTVGWDAYEYCKDCDYTTYKEIPAANHIDNDGDNKCDNGCGYEFEKLAEDTGACEHCGKEHTSFIDNIICAIKRFFKLLKDFVTVIDPEI